MKLRRKEKKWKAEGKAEAVEGIIPAEYEDDCRTAAENCPTMAIEVDEG